MLISRLTLNNVGLYRGEQCFLFSTNRKQPVTLIGGRNGTGKTTLLNAIPLVLYGNRAKSILGVSAYPEYLHDLVHDGEAQAAIVLEFTRQELGNTARYVVERSWKRTLNGKSHDQLTVSVNNERRKDLENKWAECVEGIMPMSVSGLAIFDGEKIEALADVTTSAEVLRTSLYGLLGLDLVDRLTRDLANYRRDLAQRVPPKEQADEHNLLTTNLRVAEQKLADATRDVESHSVLVSDAQAAVHDATRAVEAAARDLAETGGELFSKREALGADLAAASAQQDVCRARITALVAGDLPLMLVRPLLQQVVGMGERRRLADEATLLMHHTKERDERLLMLMLRSQTFSPDFVAAAEALMQEDRRIYEVDNHVIFDVSVATTISAQALLGDHGDGILAELDRDLKALAESIETASSTQLAFEFVPTEAAMKDVLRNVVYSEATLASAQDQLDALLAKKSEADRRFAAADRDVQQAAIELLESGQRGSDSVRIARELAASEATLKGFSKRVVERNIDQISTQILESLHLLLRKKVLIHRISIDAETLHISLFAKNEQKLDPRRLSAGERQMLATAVLWALSKATGQTLPTVIDTPVGRLDKSHRTNVVTRYFPAAARQVILLSTDEEIVGEYLDQLRPRIGKMYLLDHDEANDTTQVREGYFP